MSAISKITGMLLLIEGAFMFTALLFSAWYNPVTKENLLFFSPANDFLPILASGIIISTLGL
ncbi:MAG: hypothetical protein PHX54_11105, partial [Lentimicrobiaceae bacterium]|nr:hypothetical protein [Lentimicrobiaceae bacterium]